MRKLLIWPHCFLWMFMMMTEKILQFAVTCFPSIMRTILKYQQKIQRLRKDEPAKECFKESLEKNIPKRHSKGKAKERKIKDNKECLHNVVKYNERKSENDICSPKEVPSNGLSDANSIVHKSRPPERVKKRISRTQVVMISAVLIFLGQFYGASATSSQHISLEVKVGQNVSMKIPDSIAGDFPFDIRYTPNNNSSEVLMLCKYMGGSRSTSNPNNSCHPGISCLPKSVFFPGAEPRHSGTYSIILGCDEPECPRVLIFNLTITAHPTLSAVLETAKNGTNKTDVGGGSDNMEIIWVITITFSVLVTIVVLVAIVILAVRCINPLLYKRILNLFPWKKSSNSSNTADDAHLGMMTA